MKLLVVEDEMSLQTALVRGFTKLGYAVDAAFDGEEALELYYGSFYDAIVLDLNLPKLDGIDVLQEIRKDNALIKIIILSARSEVEHKILGLDMGANDYLAKPFHFKELEARVRALLRRDFSLLNSQLSASGMTLDIAKKKAFCQDREISLTRKEYGILEYLLVNKGSIISTEELMEHVWDSDADLFSNALKVHINAIRKKLPQEIIKTVRGQGYYVE